MALRVHLETIDSAKTALVRDLLANELPGFGVAAGPAPRDAFRIVEDEWSSDDFDFWAFDRALDGVAGGDRPLSLAGREDALPRLALEVATRVQRLLARRNRASASPEFDAVLEVHRALYDTDDPLVLADLDHALDTWQWTLRLDACASLPVQIAALFHDVERLVSESALRGESFASDYGSFKAEHARRGAFLTSAVLRDLVPPASLDRVEELVARHDCSDGPPVDAEERLLSDADALSFFSLNSPGYLASFGPVKTAWKVADSFRRLGPAARGRLSTLRLPSQVRHGIAEASERLTAAGRTGTPVSV